MIYYKNTDSDKILSTVITPTKPDEEKAILLVPEFEFLNKYDFKNFNYFNFEHSITDMTPSEFEWWWEFALSGWLYGLDERYIDIDMENIGSRFSSQDEKRIFILKVINFVMFLLPYQVLRNIFKDSDIIDISDLKLLVEDDFNLIELRENIINELDRNITQLDDFVKMLLHFEKMAKKNLAEDNIDLLTKQTQKQNFFIEIFKDIIGETDMHKFKNYLILLFENDWKNVL